MGDEGTAEALPAQFEGRLGGGLLPDGEILPVLLVDDDTVEGGDTERIFGGAGTDRVETQAGEDVPGRELARVVIARQSPGGIAILGLQDPGDDRLTLLGAADIVVQVGDLVAGLIALLASDVIVALMENAPASLRALSSFVAAANFSISRAALLGWLTRRISCSQRYQREEIISLRKERKEGKNADS